MIGALCCLHGDRHRSCHVQIIIQQGMHQWESQEQTQTSPEWEIYGHCVRKILLLKKMNACPKEGGSQCHQKIKKQSNRVFQLTFFVKHFL